MWKKEELEKIEDRLARLERLGLLVLAIFLAIGASAVLMALNALGTQTSAIVGVMWAAIAAAAGIVAVLSK